MKSEEKGRPSVLNANLSWIKGTNNFSKNHKRTIPWKSVHLAVEIRWLAVKIREKRENYASELFDWFLQKSRLSRVICRIAESIRENDKVSLKTSTCKERVWSQPSFFCFLHVLTVWFLSRYACSAFMLHRFCVVFLILSCGPVAADSSSMSPNLSPNLGSFQATTWIIYPYIHTYIHTYMTRTIYYVYIYIYMYIYTDVFSRSVWKCKKRNAASHPKSSQSVRRKS